jgi:hypothetical protein
MKTEAITAACIKRMKSIRKKLRETPLTLYQIQDIGGCRAIAEGVEHLSKLVDFYENGNSRHGIISHSRYVESPRKQGIEVTI